MGVRGLFVPDKIACEAALAALNSGRVAGVIDIDIGVLGDKCVGVGASDPSPRTTVSGRKSDAMITL